MKSDYAYTTSRYRNGFTLIELLTVLAVLAVVSTLGVTVFFRVTDAWRVTSLRLSLDNVAGSVHDTFREDLTKLVAPAPGRPSLLGVSEIEDQQRYRRIPLESDRLLLRVWEPSVEDGNPLERTVMYSIDRKSPIPRLVRTYVNDLKDDMTGKGAVRVVAEGVLAMRVEYYDGRAWTKSWNAPTLPAQVRISTVLSDPNRPYEQVGRTLTIPLRVR
jgi:prepilin-type N-terminal cleavage/methylation domain-containing protein